MPQSTALKKREDLRSVHRYPVDEMVFVTFRPLFDIVGHLIDVSSSGLALEYTAFMPGERTELVEVDIFCQPKGLNVAHIPCRVAYDFKVDDAPTFRGFQTRRCGLQFAQVSPEQSEQLKALLECCKIDTNAEQ
jgi:hypothetical protein